MHFVTSLSISSSGYITQPGRLLDVNLTPKRSEYEFLTKKSKVFRIQLCSHFGIHTKYNLPVKSYCFQIKEMGTAKKAWP